MRVVQDAFEIFARCACFAGALPAYPRGPAVLPVDVRIALSRKSITFLLLLEQSVTETYR